MPSTTIEYQALQRIAIAHDGDRFVKINLTQEIIDAMACDIRDNDKIIITYGQIPSVKVEGRQNPAIQFAFLECTIVVMIVAKSEHISDEFILQLAHLRQNAVPLAFMPYGPEWKAKMERLHSKPELIDMIADFSRHTSVNLDERKMSAHIEELAGIIKEQAAEIVKLNGDKSELKEQIGSLKQENYRLRTKYLEATGQLK